MASLMASNRMMASAFRSKGLLAARRSQNIQHIRHASSASGLPEYVYRYEGPTGKQSQRVKLQRPTRIVLMAGLDGATGPAVKALTRIKTEFENGDLNVCAMNGRLDIVLGGPKPQEDQFPRTNLLGSSCAQEIVNGQEEEEVEIFEEKVGGKEEEKVGKKEEEGQITDEDNFSTPIAPSNNYTTGYKSLGPVLNESQLLVNFETSESSGPFVRVGGPGTPNLSDIKLATYFRDYAGSPLRINVVIDPEMLLWDGRVSTPDEYVRALREMRPAVEEGEYDWGNKRASVVVDTGDRYDAETVVYSQMRVLLDHYLDVDMPEETQIDYDLQFYRCVKKVADEQDGFVLLPPAFTQPFIFFQIDKPMLLAEGTEWKWNDFEAPANFSRWSRKTTRCGSSRELDNYNDINTNEWIPFGENKLNMMYAQPLSQLRENSPIFWGMSHLLIKFVGNADKSFGKRRGMEPDTEKISDELKKMNRFNNDFLTRVSGKTSFVKRDIKKEVYESAEKYPKETEDSMFLNAPQLGRIERGVRYPFVYDASVGTVAEEVKRFDKRFFKDKRLLKEGDQNKFHWSSAAKKHFVYFRNPNDPNCRPVVVYPTIFRTQDAFSAKMEPPYKSPRLSFYFPLERGIQRSMLFLGVTRPANGHETSPALPDAISSLLQNSQSLDDDVPSPFQHKLRTLPDGRQVDYLGFVVGHECEVNFSEEAGRPWTEVTGPNKDQVGEAYACLAEVLLCFRQLNTDAKDVYVQYPAFNKNTGDIMFHESRPLTKYWD